MKIFRIEFKDNTSIFCTMPKTRGTTDSIKYQLPNHLMNYLDFCMRRHAAPQDDLKLQKTWSYLEEIDEYANYSFGCETLNAISCTFLTKSHEKLFFELLNDYITLKVYEIDQDLDGLLCNYYIGTQQVAFRKDKAKCIIEINSKKEYFNYCIANKEYHD